MFSTGDGEKAWLEISVTWRMRLLFTLLVLLLGPTVVAAQEGDSIVVRNEALVDFPHTVTFRLELEPGSRIVGAALTYQLGQDSCLEAGTRVPVEVSGSALEWTWVMSRSGNPPPGASMWWQWEVAGLDGRTVTLPRRELTFTDDRFEWRSLEAEMGALTRVRLHWYEGDEVGPLLLEATVAGLERLQQDMGITLDGEVQLFIYASADDMQEAVLYIQDWAGGVAFSDYDVILLGVPPYLAETWGSDTVRHELAHLVIDQFGRSCVGGSRPTWLNEGLAEYAEGEPDEETLSDITRGIEENDFEPVRSLNGAFPVHGEQASAAYSQSYSLVAYLLETYGQDKMKLLLRTMAAGEGYDAALEQVYGFNADGLETAWRASIGAALRPIPPTPTPIRADQVPTVVPLGAVQNRPTPEGLAADLGTSPSTEPGRPFLCGLGLLPLMLLGIVVFRKLGTVET